MYLVPFINVNNDALGWCSFRIQELEIQVNGGVVFENKDLLHTASALATLSSVVFLKTVKKTELIL